MIAQDDPAQLLVAQLESRIPRHPSGQRHIAPLIEALQAELGCTNMAARRQLVRILDEGAWPRRESLAAIARALEVKPHELFMPVEVTPLTHCQMPRPGCQMADALGTDHG